MAEMIIRRERVLDTFAAHETCKNYDSKLDTIMHFALVTGYDIDMVMEERKLRQLV